MGYAQPILISIMVFATYFFLPLIAKVCLFFFNKFFVYFAVDAIKSIWPLLKLLLQVDWWNFYNQDFRIFLNEVTLVLKGLGRILLLELSHNNVVVLIIEPYFLWDW